MSTAGLAGFRTGAERQFRILVRLPDYLTFIAMTPLSTVMFLAIVRSAGRADLSINALIGVSLIIMWQTGVWVAGDTLARDRQHGLLELNLAAPVPIERVVLGRVAVSAVYAFIPFVLSLATARLVFGPDAVDIADPGRMALVGLFTWFAATAAFLCMASIFVLSGRSTALANGLSYPLFLVAGVVVPVTFLPDWLQAVSGAVFLRWTAQGMRAAAEDTGASVVTECAMLALLAAVMFAVGSRLLRIVIDRMRSTGAVIAA